MRERHFSSRIERGVTAYLTAVALLLSAVCIEAANTITGYYPYWAYYRDGSAVTDIDTSRLDYLIYSGAVLNKLGSVVPGDDFADMMRPQEFEGRSDILGSYAAIKMLKQQSPDLKALISIGGWQGSYHFSEILADPEKRERMIETTLAYTSTYYFDGFEFDWRFPSVAMTPESSAHHEDVQRFTRFLADLRAACGKCVIAVTVAAESHYRPGWDFPELAKHVDFFHLLNTTFVGGWSPRTGHKSQLYSDPSHPLLSTDAVVDELLQQGLPAAKLILRVTAEGIGLENVEANNNGLYQEFDGISLGTWDNDVSGKTGLFAYREILALERDPEYTLHWDDQVKSHSLYNKRRRQFISYESSAALAEKLRFVDEKGLGGVALWELTSDASGAEGHLNQIFEHYHSTKAKLLRARDFLLEMLPFVLIVAFASIATYGFLRWRDKEQAGKQQLITQRRVHQALLSLPQHLDHIIYLVISPPQSLVPRLSPSQYQSLEQLAQTSASVRNQLLPVTQAMQRHYIDIGSESNVIGGESNASLLAEEGRELKAPIEHIDYSETKESEVQVADSALLSLERFTHLLADTHSLEKMMETMFQFLACDIRVSGVALWNEGEIVQSHGVPTDIKEMTEEASSFLELNEDRQKALLGSHDLGDFRITLEFDTALSPSEEAYFRGLGNQVIFARQQFRELAGQPQLLKEIYEVAHRREKLLFIKGEKGYSGIHASDMASPIFVFSRLRALRMYFPELLVQVHRSYLVNPKAVLSASKSNSRYELNLGSHTIPVARSYLAKLKQNFPEWFQQEGA